MSFPGFDGRDLVVLGGGGAKGGFQWGVWQVLWAAGIRPDAVWGVSVGSQIGFLLACHDMELVNETFGSIKKLNQLFRKRFLGLLRNPPGQYSMAPLMKNYVNKYALRYRLKVPYYPVWVSMKRGTADGGSIVVKEAKEYASDKMLGLAIQASSAIPLVMAPPLIYDEIGVDGGVIDVVPMRWALEDASPGDRVCIVACRAPDDVERWRNSRPNAIELLERMENVALAERIRNDVSSQLIAEARERGVEVRVIWPHEDHGTTLDFDQEHLNGWRAHGHSLATRLMDRWYPDALATNTELAAQVPT